MFRTRAVIASVLLLAPVALLAQGGGRGRVGGGAIGRDRGQLEQQLRERLAAVVKERLNLTDDQMSRLTEVNQRYDQKRRDLIRRDMMNRRTLREQLQSETPAEDRVNALLLERQKLDRERVELIESEQTDLSKFLTAVQRAKYLGIQEQMRQRIEQLRPRPPFMDEPPAGGGSRGGGMRRRPPAP